MNELLTALVAASKVGFDAPKCPGCSGRGWYAGLARHGESTDVGPIRDCQDCFGAGLDASDPERLIGRAESWLLARGLDIKVTWRALDVFTLVDPDGYHERHDGTLVGLATALLRLVARTGGAE